MGDGGIGSEGSGGDGGGKIWVRKWRVRSIGSIYPEGMMLNFETCYRALQTRDARFDGRFFTAVRTTGIFCRPICPAPTPRPENCQFFTSAAAAHEAGFRPCLRCRPELSPDLLSYVTTASTVNRALRLIGEGFLDEQSVVGLANRLGVGDRHLRRLFDQHIGVSPVAVAQTRRMLFAKQLIDQTTLPMTDVAIAAGFKSLRRFNAAMLATYQKAPRELRRLQVTEQSTQVAEIQLRLAFQPPYHWDALVHFLKPRLMTGVEQITSTYYGRSIELEGAQGAVLVQPVPDANYLLAQIRFPKVTALSQIVERLRRLFDLSANVNEIAAHLQTDRSLAPLVAALPGLRIPGAWDPFELAVRAILGQQVSVSAAATLASRLVQRYGKPFCLEGLGESWPESIKLAALFPNPEILAEADLTEIGVTSARARAIQALAAKVAIDRQFFQTLGDLEAAVAQLCELPGIGPWTAQYIAMRALREPDAFPAGDLALRRALDQSLSPQELEARSQVWRPWRAYAAMHLWMMNFAAQKEECK